MPGTLGAATHGPERDVPEARVTRSFRAPRGRRRGRARSRSRHRVRSPGSRALPGGTVTVVAASKCSGQSWIVATSDAVGQRGEHVVEHAPGQGEPVRDLGRMALVSQVEGRVDGARGTGCRLRQLKGSSRSTSTKSAELAEGRSVDGHPSACRRRPRGSARAPRSGSSRESSPNVGRGDATRPGTQTEPTAHARSAVERGCGRRWCAARLGVDRRRHLRHGPSTLATSVELGWAPVRGARVPGACRRARRPTSST